MAQEFLSQEAKLFYPEPNEPRPTNNTDEIVERDDESDDDEALEDFFDAE